MAHDGRVRLLRIPGTYPPQGDTALLARAVRDSGLAAGQRVLDVCTGTGALAITAAATGAATVTAVDLSARSVLTARLNVALNLAHVRVRRGDLFAPVAGQRFDLVTANPPYVPARTPGLPRHGAARSWDAGPDGRALLDRIAAEVGDVLAPGQDREEVVVVAARSPVPGESGAGHQVRVDEPRAA